MCCFNLLLKSLSTIQTDNWKGTPGVPAIASALSFNIGIEKIFKKIKKLLETIHDLDQHQMQCIDHLPILFLPRKFYLKKKKKPGSFYIILLTRKTQPTRWK